MENALATFVFIAAHLLSLATHTLPSGSGDSIAPDKPQSGVFEPNEAHQRKPLRPKILWVPIEQRREAQNKLSTAVSSAFYEAQRKNKEIGEKVERIGRMLNDSFDMSGRELNDGTKRLTDLTTRSVPANRGTWISTIGLSIYASVAFAFLSLPNGALRE